MFHFLAVIALAALLGYAIGCDAEHEVSVMAEVGDAIVILPYQEPTLAECKEEWSSPSSTEDEVLAYPTPPSVPEIQESIGLFLVPQSVPEGLKLTRTSIEDDSAFMLFRDPWNSEHQPRGRVLTIDQGPMYGDVWRLELKEGYYEQATVRGVAAVVIQGGFVIDMRTEDGAQQVVSCGWVPEEVTSLVFVRNGYGYRLAGSPAESFPPSELIAIAESLAKPANTDGN